jgi:hypothetical protein
MNSNYGYIKQPNTYTPQPNDVVWTVHRVEYNGVVKTYSCIESTRDLAADTGVVNKGTGKNFRAWRDKYAEPEEI